MILFSSVCFTHRPTPTFSTNLNPFFFSHSPSLEGGRGRGGEGIQPLTSTCLPSCMRPHHRLTCTRVLFCSFFVPSSLLMQPHAAYLRPCGTNLADAEESTSAFVSSVRSATVRMQFYLLRALCSDLEPARMTTTYAQRIQSYIYMCMYINTPGAGAAHNRIYILFVFKYRVQVLRTRYEAKQASRKQAAQERENREIQQKQAAAAAKERDRGAPPSSTRGTIPPAAPFSTGTAVVAAGAVQSAVVPPSPSTSSAGGVVGTPSSSSGDAAAEAALAAGRQFAAVAAAAAATAIFKRSRAAAASAAASASGAHPPSSPASASSSSSAASALSASAAISPSRGAKMAPPSTSTSVGGAAAGPTSIAAAAIDWMEVHL